MDNVPAELQNFWTTVERKCAGTLFLQVWNAVMDADGAGPPTPKLLNWTLPETIEAFASWLTDYDGQEMVEIKLDGVVLMQTPAALISGLASWITPPWLITNQLKSSDCKILLRRLFVPTTIYGDMFRTERRIRICRKQRGM
ncbi:hypothetical protein FRB95_002711 [Tulasnella sp. JGI-2019a]|nr:hypothetical protein FRB95_002711 [Tulasnella sp. JGI-2019a]